VGSVGAPELIVIFVVALIVLGPERLPGMARQMGKAMGEFRRMSAGFQDEVKRALDDPDERPASYTPPEAASTRPTTPTTPSEAELPPPPDDPSRN
jgi:sec-independent protein translocase protein TatB